MASFPWIDNYNKNRRVIKEENIAIGKIVTNKKENVKIEFETKSKSKKINHLFSL